MGAMAKDIYLIEDDIDHAELISTFIKVDGIDNKIIWFKDAESAIERLSELVYNENDFPALIIIDLKLPRMSGFQLISYINSIDKFSGIPIIVITSSSQPSDISRALELGAREVINKLAEIDKLADKVRQYL